MLTEIEKELGFLLKSRGVDRDSCIGVLIMLKTERRYKKMINWIKNNPNAGQYEILGELDVFKKKSEPVRKTRKIAVL